MSGTILHESRPRARKRHTCTLCLLPIEPGTVYRFYTFAAEGTVSTLREHDECSEIVWLDWQMEGDDPIDVDALRDELAARSGAGSGLAADEGAGK